AVGEGERIGVLMEGLLVGMEGGEGSRGGCREDLGVGGCWWVEEEGGLGVMEVMVEEGVKGGWEEEEWRLWMV
uniref:hypothetical protein n=1 Tax=Micrococcus luteus TaxID=1270 RepID=UPI001C93035A